MKKIVTFLTALSLLMTSGMSVYASETSVAASIDPETGTITLTGSADGTTTIRVTKADVDIESLNDGNMPTDLHQITSKGILAYEFQLPEGAEDGKYYVSVTDKNGTASDTVFVFDKDDAEAVFNTYLNKNLSENEFVNAVLSHAEELGIDVEHEDYSSDVLRGMYQLNSRYTNYNDFYASYELCRVLTALKGKNVAAVESYLKKYENILGIDYTDAYEKSTVLTSADKTTLCNLISAIDYIKIYKSAENITGKSGFTAVFDALSALAAADNAESWKAIEKIYTQDFAFLKNNVVSKNSDYTTGKSADIFGYMLTKEFDSISDLKDNFDSAVTAKGGSDDNKSSGRGGSFSVGAGASTSGIFEEVPGAAANEEGFSIKAPILTQNHAEFIDVNTGDWFYNPVSVLAANGIVNGYSDGGFYPNNNITRAEFTKLIISAFSVTGKKASFGDVSENVWYHNCVSIAGGAGIVTGYNGNFNPDSNITRQDASVIIYRVAALLNMPYEGFEQSFTDVDDISLYALTAVGALNKNGIVSGVGNGMFMPMRNITRAEAVQLIYNVISDLQNRA